MHSNAPLIKRPGQVDAWDNADFKAAVKATGKKQVILAGITTDVCTVIPTLRSAPLMTLCRYARRSSRCLSARRATPSSRTATRPARSTRRLHRTRTTACARLACMCCRCSPWRASL